jgi:methylmalonyl-CoA mutase, N-terminal domain
MAVTRPTAPTSTNRGLSEGRTTDAGDASARLAAAAESWQKRAGIEAEATTDSGLEVKPVYTPLDAPGLDGYLERVGFPGEAPFTRGIYPSMYRGRLWTRRMYAGWGSPQDTNARFRYLLDHGQTGLSVALDLPTQMGYDSDHPLALPEIGKVGVAVDTLADMEAIFDGIPLDRVSTSFTINATAAALLAMYVAVGEAQGVDRRELRGTVQNDLLKEFLARKTYIYPPGPSLRLVTDVLEWSASELPTFNPISVCGYHLRQAGCDAVQEIAYTLANAATYLQGAVDRGVGVDIIAPRFSFNFSTMRDFFEEIAKHRAARRMWCRIVRDRFGAQDPRSWQLRLFSGGDGTSLTATEPLNNVARVTLQTLAIVLSGAQAVHSMSWDEALGLPTEDAARLGLRTQQILAYESGVARSIDPLGGSYLVESLTDELERRAETLLAEIEAGGGMLEAVISGRVEQAIADEAWAREQSIESGDTVVVGVNRFVDEDAEQQAIEVFRVRDEVRDHQLERLRRVRAERDDAAVRRALDAVAAAAADERRNLMPATLEAVRAYATVGEISSRLETVFGRHVPSRVI